MEDTAVATIWQSMEDNHRLFNSKEDVLKYMAGLSVDSRVLFLAHSLRYALDKALKSNAKTVLIDGYYFKYFAPELALGANETLVRQLISQFPEPDLILRLQLDPSIAYSRKKKVTPYECGFNAAVSEENFVAFQNQVLDRWNFFDLQNATSLHSTTTAADLASRAFTVVSEKTAF